jgi:hypothetical protein
MARNFGEATLPDWQPGFSCGGLAGERTMNEKRLPTEAALRRWRGRRARIEKLRNGSNKLGGRERLRQHDAVGDAF